MKLTWYQLKYTALNEVRQVSLRLVYLYLLANDRTVNLEYTPPLSIWSLTGTAQVITLVKMSI